MASSMALSEAALHDLWRMRRIPQALLRTTSGEPIAVVNPGRHNHDAGPDFLGATLRLGDKILHGDVELHLEARDWTAHGHHRDPAYNGVILHVALFTSSAEDAGLDIVRENGLLSPQLMLPASLLQESTQQEMVLFDCPLSRTAPEKILATVRHAGQLRFEAKAMAFAEQMRSGSWDQAVYRGIAEALGYDKNQEPFRRLTELLPIDLIFAELRSRRANDAGEFVEALIFGAAGFLAHRAEANEPHDAEVAAFVSARQRIWEPLRHSLQIRPLPVESWRFFQLRPQNFPTRRLAGLCSIILKFYRHGILEHLSRLLQAPGKRGRKLAQELVSFFLCPAQGFWQTHYHLRGRKNPQPAAPGDLVGRDRSRDILVNLILPALWLYYREAGNAIFQNQAQEVYAHLPKLQENRATQAMQQQLSRFNPPAKELSTSAKCQQGMLHLQKLFCRPLRCEECLGLQPGISVSS